MLNVQRKSDTSFGLTHSNKISVNNEMYTYLTCCNVKICVELANFNNNNSLHLYSAFLLFQSTQSALHCEGGHPPG